jgi:hypothetical protein
VTPEAKTVWAALEFRKPMLLRNVEPLSDAQWRWRPAPGRPSVAWQVWHIAEVEDVWVGSLVLGETPRFPFGVQVREATDDRYPAPRELLDYLHEAREISRHRLASMTVADFDRVVEDPDFGHLAVRDVWAGVATSFAWHAGQVAMTAKMIPDTPVTTQPFGAWRHGPGT